MEWVKRYDLIEKARRLGGYSGCVCDECPALDVCVKAWCAEMDDWEDATRDVIRWVRWTFPCGLVIYGSELA